MEIMASTFIISFMRLLQGCVQTQLVAEHFPIAVHGVTDLANLIFQILIERITFGLYILLIRFQNLLNNADDRTGKTPNISEIPLELPHKPNDIFIVVVEYFILKTFDHPPPEFQ